MSVEAKGGNTGLALSGGCPPGWSLVGRAWAGWGWGSRGSAGAEVTVRCIQVETPGRQWSLQVEGV